jgi:hypothetical protein
MRAHSFAFAFALALAGCGFVGEPPFSGTRVPDVAPWEDLGPLTVCDGIRRIGPLAESPLGTCNAAAQPACTSDADCGSREICLCGACQLPVCDTNDECGTGRVCTFGDRVCDRACVTDGDCVAGELCVPGQHICRGTCAATGDCQRGERCDAFQGLCVPVTCSDDRSCGGRTCALARIPASLAEPSPVVDGDTITMWLERDGAIWRAVSSDGRIFRFDPAAPLVDGHAPAVARDALGQWWAAWVAADHTTTVAQSSDGLTFTPYVTGIAAEQPAILVDNGSAVFYGVRGGAIGRIVPDDFAAVLRPADVTTDLWQGVDALASPWFDTSGRLWFSAHGTETGPSMQFGQVVPTPPDWSIGVAFTADRVTWLNDRYNPVFDRTVDFTKHPSELDPAVVSFHGQEWLYYRRAAPDGTQSENLAVARNPAAPR